MLIDENDELIVQHVLYDWKPILCKRCTQLGHDEVNCRAGQPSSPKNTSPPEPIIMPLEHTVPNLVIPTTLQPVDLPSSTTHPIELQEEDDAQGFQHMRSKARKDNLNPAPNIAATVLPISNGFEVLAVSDLNVVGNNSALGASPHTNNV